MRLLLLLAAAVVPQHGGEAEHAVSAGFKTFTPPNVRLLTGESVVWTNDSARAHTVTGEGFDSGRLGPRQRFRRRFETPGTHSYVCTLHVGMAGSVEVARLLLDPPAAPAAPRRPYPVSGRAALPAGTEVVVLGDEVPLARTAVGADGRWAATIAPSTSVTLRAVAEGVHSAPASLVVLDRTVRTRRRGRSLGVTVTPAAPGQTVVLQLRLPLRFGWWPVHRAKLDQSSRATFRLPRRRVPYRVALTLADRATVLATSAPRRVGRPDTMDHSAHR